MENLYSAFIQFQNEFQGLRPDSKNPFFKSTYISLDGILQTVRPLLSKYGLAVLQEATGDGEYIYIKTKLIHKSGEMFETDILKMKPVKANDPQAMGSVITYAKRYQLGALLGICETVDDDANKGSGLKADKQAQQPQRINGDKLAVVLDFAKKKDVKDIKEVLKKNGYNSSAEILVKDFAIIVEQLKMLEDKK